MGEKPVRTLRKRGIGLLPIIALLLAACGGGDQPTTEPTDAAETPESPTAPEETTDTGGELTPITVGILPIADLAPLYHAIDQGYFEEEGLDVTMEIGQGGAALVPAVVNGDYQFAFGNYVSLMLARQNNVPVSIVQNIVDGADSADRGTNALLVGPDSGIEDVSGLAGKRFAVSTINNVGEVTIRTTLRNNDVDDSSIDIVEMPFPDMNGAVEAGQVDVSWVPEPFVTLGESAGLVNIVDPMHGTMPSMPLAGMFASDQWLGDNPDLAEAFVTALRRGMEDASDDAAMQAAIVANTQTTEDLVTQIALANWNPDLETDKLAEIGSLAVEYGILEAEPDMSTLVWQNS